MYIYIYTHTHTHIYIHTYICVCVCVFVFPVCSFDGLRVSKYTSAGASSWQCRYMKATQMQQNLGPCTFLVSNTYLKHCLSIYKYTFTGDTTRKIIHSLFSVCWSMLAVLPARLTRLDVICWTWCHINSLCFCSEHSSFDACLANAVYCVVFLSLSK